MTRVKICGIKTLPDAMTAADAGADLLGFNFYPKSIRFIEVQSCARITSILKKQYPSIQLVGVFVNSPLEEINKIMDLCGLDLAQLHGDETVETASALDGKAFKAFHGIPVDVERFARNEPPAFLVDASVDGLYGGSGVTADWNGAAQLAKRYPLLLAGGLNPENVAGAVQQVKPWGVDVASGVETGPGQKHAGRIKAFVNTVKSTQIEWS
jgi:phosphoribosylanthranilate isomerase